MPVTTNPQDKFAFLFSGSTDPRFQSDLLNVYTALIQYYNYPASHIWVAWGGPADISSVFTGIVNKKIVSTASDLTAFYGLFATAVEANSPGTPASNLKNTAVIYFTGTAIDAGIGPFGAPAELIIKKGTPDIGMTSLELKTMLSSVLFSQSHINLIMQQDFANNFVSNLFSNGINSNDKTVTHINGSQNAPTDTTGDGTGGIFTKSWVAGLQMQKVFDGTSNVYADEISGSFSSDPLHATMEQLKMFADLKSGVTYSFQLLGETKTFLGKLEFQIMDGDEITPSPRDMDRSPDIWLKNSLYTAAVSDNCYFVTGSNDIGVRIRNVGTHPVRTFYYGIRIYRNSAPGGIDQYLPSSAQNLIIMAGSSTVLLNTHSFPADIYQDIKVRVTSFPIPDLNIWDIDKNLNEAQRSIYPPLSASAVVSTPILCNGGTGVVTINATGGAPPLSYTLNGGVPVATNIFPAVPYGLGMTWSVTDKYGSTLSGPIDVVQPTQITGGAIVTVPITVIGGTATVQVSGTGGTGSLDCKFNGVSSLTGLFSGISAGTGHTWRITDANGCYINGTLDVASPSPITVSGSLTHVIRFGNNTGKIILSVTPGLPADYLYSWDNGAVTKDITGLTAGFYTVTVTHILTGNSKQATFEIIHPYINIQKTVLYALEIEFRDYPVLSGVLAKRFYEVLWRGKLPAPPSLLFPKPTITTKNITVINMVQVVISGQQWVKATISVPKGKVGLVSIKPQKLFPPFGRRTINVPVKIYYVSQYPIIIPRRNLLIADFKIIPGLTSIDFIL